LSLLIDFSLLFSSIGYRDISGEARITEEQKKDEDAKGWVKAWFFWVTTVHVVVDKFGWAGSFLFVITFFVIYYSTPGQKERIIETYVLGNSPHRVLPLFVMSLLGLLVLFAQAKWYNRDKNAYEDRLKECEKEKEQLRAKIAKARRR
jgi:hypothetical protein